MSTFHLKGVHVMYETLRDKDGFRLQLFVQFTLDDSMDVLTHEELFATPYEVKRLRAAVGERGVLNLDHWVWVPSEATPFGNLQVKPTAVLKQEIYQHKF